MAKVRVVLADDHHAMLSVVRQILAEEFDVVAAVEGGEQAVDAILKLNPDALVIDISMPILNGLQAAKQLQTAHCRSKIIFITVHEGLEFVDAAFSAGAYGYVTKSHLSTDLVPAIHKAMLGQTFVSGSLPTIH
jgi:DNA-binding NarL/FixJ family response regulator